MVETLTTKQRSKTAPIPLSDVPLHAASLVSASKSSEATGRRNVKLVLAGADLLLSEYSSFEVAVDYEPARSPLMTPRHTGGEDPFSLTGFFPSRPGSPSSAHPVDWVTGDSEIQHNDEQRANETRDGIRKNTDRRGAAGRGREQKHMHVHIIEESGAKRLHEPASSGPTGGLFSWQWRKSSTSGAGLPPSRSLSMGALDDYAREVIDKESSVGIMGLARVPSFLRGLTFGNKWGVGGVDKDEGEDEENDSDEIEEDEGKGDWRVYDEDTLLEAMHGRRTASERELAGLGGLRMVEKKAKSSDSLGVLFTPTD